MGFVFWFSWALFIVFEKVTLRMPWPIKHFVIGQFPGEFEAQRQIMRLKSKEVLA
jgi:hypothetical protein